MSKVRYEYEAPDGTRMVREYEFGKAPKSVRVAGVRWKRAIVAPALIAVGDTRAGRAIDYTSDQLVADLHGKYHRGRIITNEHGERKLHFSSRADEEHLRKAWNDSPDAQVHGKLRRAGEADEWSDDVKRGRVTG